MPDRPFNVLFLCTGNSARSIMAEVILNKLGAGKFRAYSAGSHPKGRVNPHTIQLLQSLGYDTSGFRSKSWIDDPAGIAWETFFTTGESTEYGDGTGEREARIAQQKVCCEPQATSQSVHQPGSACCTT